MEKVNVFLAGPSDTVELRKCAEESVRCINNIYHDENLMINVYDWKSRAVPSSVDEEELQKKLTGELVYPADIVVAIFNAKPGVETSSEISGTLEEIKEARVSDKHVLVYFEKDPKGMKDLSVMEFAKYKSILGEVQKKFLYCEFDGVQDFCNKFNIHIQKLIRRIEKRNQLAHPMLALSKEEGINNIFRSPPQPDELFFRNIEASKHIRVLAMTGRNLLLEACDKPLMRALRNGATIEILNATPDSDLVKDLGAIEEEIGDRKGERENFERINNEIKMMRGSIKEKIVAAAKRQSGTFGRIGHLYYGHFSTEMRNPVVICDNRWAWLTLWLPPNISRKCISLELVATGEGGLIVDCINYFDKVKSKTTMSDLVLEDMQ